MKTFLLVLSALVLFGSCKKDPDNVTLTVDKYTVGIDDELTVKCSDDGTSKFFAFYYYSAGETTHHYIGGNSEGIIKYYPSRIMTWKGYTVIYAVAFNSKETDIKKLEKVGGVTSNTETIMVN